RDQPDANKLTPDNPRRPPACGSSSLRVESNQRNETAFRPGQTSRRGDRDQVQRRGLRMQRLWLRNPAWFCPSAYSQQPIKERKLAARKQQGAVSFAGDFSRSPWTRTLSIRRINNNIAIMFAGWL